MSTSKLERVSKSGKKSSKKFPDLELYVNGVRDGEMETCTGVKELVQALSALSPKTKPLGEVWKAVNVRRNGEDLGSLHHVRQVYHRFQIERDSWAKVMNVPYRPSRDVVKAKKEKEEALEETEDE